MGVKLARTAGFCMGVRRAMDMVLDIARKRGKGPIYTYGPLIHNPQAVELLKRRGILPVRDPGEIPGGMIVIRAHGISPDERSRLKEKGIEIIDATCPKVARVQGIIKKHSSMGYTVLILGDENHPEVAGLLGYAGGRGKVIQGPGDLEGLPVSERICLVAQTTQNVEAFEETAAAVRDRFPEAVVFDTICDSTMKRQQEVRDMARTMDAMIIVGGRNSANTERLRAISEGSNTPTFLVETADELKGIELESFENIGVSAGASTPNWIINSVLEHIVRNEKDKRRSLLKTLRSLWTWSVGTDLFKALGAASLTLAAMVLEGFSPGLLSLFTSAFYVHSMHTFNRIQEKTPPGDALGETERRKIRKRRALLALATLSLALFTASLTGFLSFLLLLSISSFGLLYDIPLFPARWSVRKISAIPGSKNLLIAFAWATVCAVIPHAADALPVRPGMVVAFLFVLSLVFIVSALSDLMDIQSDRLVGRETIPVVIGESNTRLLLLGVCLLLGILLVLSYATGMASPFSLILLTSVIYLWICLPVYDRRFSFSALNVEGLLETNLILPGVCAGLWLFF
jgi:4-hydroxy-3-methylbut-2-enyl diphosphate reductase